MITEAHLQGLEKALEAGGATHGIEHVFAAVQQGTAQLWIDKDAVMVTEINCAPREKELHFWLATGKLEDLISLSNKVLDWGREQGCTVATLSGRRGWIKALEPIGWEPKLVTMARRL